MWAVGHYDVEMRRALSAEGAIPPAPPSSPRHRLAQRQKQLDMGKATAGYARYVEEVPVHERDPARALGAAGHGRRHPRTPDPRRRVSKRAFDGHVSAWRRALHEWDEAETPMPVRTPAASKWTLPRAAALRRSEFWRDVAEV